jgi:hypothetical protein
MPNTISSTWQFPTGSEYGNRLDQAAQAEQLTGMGSAPVAAELGVATTPIREGGAPVVEAQVQAPETPEQYHTNTGEAIPTDYAEDVLNATRGVMDALDTPVVAAPAPEVVQDAEHDRAALARMKFYGPTLETIRDSYLA